VNDYLKAANLECFLAWQEKYRRCYVEADPWAGGARLLFDRHYERKRRAARFWLVEKSSRWRRKAVAVGEGVDMARPGVRPIWTARSAFKRRES